MRSVLLAITLAFSTQAAKADCPELIEWIEYSDGSQTQVLSRGEGRLTTLRGSNETKVAVEVTQHLGLFTLEAKSKAGRIVIDWSDPLPTSSDLVTDASFRLEATQNSGNRSAEMVVDVKVSGSETLTVGDCSYPVLRIDSHLDRGGLKSPKVEWLHVPSLLVLRSERPDESVENHAVKLR